MIIYLQSTGGLCLIDLSLGLIEWMRAALASWAHLARFARFVVRKL